MRILSYEYLQWQGWQLRALVGELDPHNLHRLLRALDKLESLIDDLLEVLIHSGNKGTASYESAYRVEEKRIAVRELLEGLTEDERSLELSIIHLQWAVLTLGRVLQAKLAVAFPFSMN